MREIDYSQLIKNYEEMINLMEYDSMRSAGKSKINASTLVDLHKLKALYSEKVKKQTPKKEVS